MSGWVRVQRDVFDHDFFAKEPMSEREAWLWMLAKAAWDNTRHRVGSQMVDVPRGSFMVTLRELQSVFMWRSDTKVRNFLKRLEAERMIERTTCGPKNAPKTHVTICNYDEYQSRERTKNAPKTHQTRHEKRTKETNKQITKEVEAQSEPLPEDILAGVASRDTAANFVAYRREIKKPLTKRSAVAMANKIRGHADPDAVLNESIANGWQGVFPDKVKSTQSARQGRTDAGAFGSLREFN